MKDAPPFVSVIVPVRNRMEKLRQCLDALGRQSYPKDRYEIIVVDNDSSQDLQAICAGCGGVVYVKEPGIGSYAARNAGIRASKGDVIAFTDSDCIPSRGWLACGVRDLIALDCDIIGGRVEYFPSSNEKLNIFEIFEEVRLSLARQEAFVKGNSAVTANVITHRASFERTGLYDSSLRSLGDIVWANQAVKKGLKLKYSADAVVYHSRRNTRRDVVLKVKRAASGTQNLKLRQGQWKSAIYDLGWESPLSPSILRFALFCPRIRGFAKRFWFVVLTYHCSLVATAERIKVSLGGPVFRGD
jgi:glycosyltransferase involved in cell wall biosynthesis